MPFIDSIVARVLERWFTSGFRAIWKRNVSLTLAYGGDR